MKTWHFRRIKFVPLETPVQAANGDWVFFHVCVKNSDPNSPFRQTNWACETLGM